MDELFGSAGFAAADTAMKERIEREIGLTALLDGDISPDETAVTAHFGEKTKDAATDGQSDELNEIKE